MDPVSWSLRARSRADGIRKMVQVLKSFKPFNLNDLIFPELLCIVAALFLRASRTSPGSGLSAWSGWGWGTVLNPGACRSVL